MERTIEMKLSELVKQCFGTDMEISDVRAVSGGDINEASLVLLSDGRRFFLKENSRKNAGFFRAEQKGLEAIRKTGAIQVPDVMGTGVFEGRSYLIMEYLEAAPKKRDYWEIFGRQLAAMHRFDPSEWTSGKKYGFSEDNYIGAGEQDNTPADSWIEFFRTYRLGTQIQRADRYFSSSDKKALQSLLDHLDEVLLEPEAPSLLHGDLWGGNFVTGPDGTAWLIDPAVYVGHAEADLAMTELFGGFAPDFYDSYREVNSFEPGYADRREIYNLYHLLNHLNLFGSGYYSSVMHTVHRFAR